MYNDLPCSQQVRLHLKCIAFHIKRNHPYNVEFHTKGIYRAITVMACRSCEERKQIVKESYRQGGIRKVIKNLPKLASHLRKNPPEYILAARDAAIKDKYKR